ncbi:hypothetical protein B0T19DRAFT_406736 [Cercophora scortea]|uniref:DUF3074 domain-containing protein n=1 Tax=Cercophora scortea TaxID=314031 RepID=A0AAE0J2A2_9PEZI|nr:hypothetical protein B0T19DRAFT_406736 [Cercophora scortea]
MAGPYSTYPPSPNTSFAHLNPSTHVLLEHSDTLGHYIRLQRGLKCKDLPKIRCQLRAEAFLTPIVREAVIWMYELEASFHVSSHEANKPTRALELRRKTKTLFGKDTQSHGWEVGLPRTIKGSDGTVTVAQRVVSRAQLETSIHPEERDNMKDEVWVARRSEHRSLPGARTATWDEFKKSFYGLSHIPTEYSTTKGLKAWNKVFEWDHAETLRIKTDGVIYSDFTFAVYEIRHEHAPATPRVFSVLQITFCKRTNTEERKKDAENLLEEFMVVSLPISDLHLQEEAVITKQPNTKLARYVAVERFRKRAYVSGDGMPGNAHYGPHYTEWLMATTTDPGFARGRRGSALKHIADVKLPGIICEDVSNFFEWLARRRAENADLPVIAARSQFWERANAVQERVQTEQESEHEFMTGERKQAV